MKKVLYSSVTLALLSVGFSGCTQRDCPPPPVKPAKVMKPVCNCVTPKPAPVCKTASMSLPKNTPVLKVNKTVKISVVGQGVAPCNGSCSPAQALALAKRAAIADAYRQIAEKVKGVYVEGNDYIKNMMVKKSTVRTSVTATVRNANIVETTFKEGLCEVEMEVKLRYTDIVR